MNIEQLYKTNQRNFLHKILPYVKSREIAEDIVQDAFVKAVSCIDQYNPKRGEIKGWFNKILFSTLWNYKRKAKKTPHSVCIDDILENEELSYQEGDWLEGQIRLVKNPDHQRILFAYMALGYSDREAALVCETSPENVRKVVQRFREGEKK